MKRYKIFENPAGRREAVKQGWSWPAFFFTFIWAFCKRMYATGALLLGAAILLGFISNKVDELFAMGDRSARSTEFLCHLAQWALMVVMGVNGNELRQRSLTARGYSVRGTVAADTPQGALAAPLEEEHQNAGQPD